MLPVQDVIPSRTTPWVTFGLMAVIALTLLVELLLSEPSLRDLILSYGLVPAHVSAPSLVTSAFLHHGISDASVNIVALWLFGDNVEDRLGRARYVLLFASGAVLSGLAAVWMGQDSTGPIIGAAGATGAVIGAYLILLPASRILMLVPVWRSIDLVEVPAAVVVLAWALLTGLLPAAQSSPFVSLPAVLTPQAAGLLTGAALARLLARPERLRCAWWNVVPAQPPDRRRTSRETSARSASSASN
jgi:membrane associated rhomboid family serine protease